MKSFVYTFRVHIEDTDCYGIVYHSNYLNFYERARSEWMEQNGFGMQWQEQQDVLFAIRAVEMEYELPAKTPDLLEVVIDDVQVRKASMVIAHHLRYQHKPEVILNRSIVKICCISSALKVRPVPTVLREELISGGK